MKEKTKTNIIGYSIVVIIIIFAMFLSNVSNKNMENTYNIKENLCNENGLEFDNQKNICFDTTNGFVKTYGIIYLNGDYYLKD